MPSEEHYDDTAFNYFALSVLLIIIVPSTISYYKTWKKTLSNEYNGICGCSGCRKKAKQLQLDSRKPTMFGLFKFTLYLGVIVLFGFMLMKAMSAPIVTNEMFDPYATLELDHGASEEEIKKAYRRLSLRWHPDKATEPEASDKFISIAKAHKTLTDDATREKWEKYGNPDGPQGLSVGIALPSWLVDTQNSMVVLGVYAVFLMIVFPTIAICWWSKQKDLAHNSLNNKTMYYFYQTITEHMRFKKLITVMCLSYEYVTAIKLRRSDEVILKKLKPLIPEIDSKPKKESAKQKPGKKPKLTVPPHAIKNVMMLYAHFARQSKLLESDPQLRKEYLILLRESHKVMGGMVELTAGRRWVIPTMESIKLFQMMTQAVWSGTCRLTDSTELLQIPHFTQSQAEKLSGKKYRINTVPEFIQLPSSQRREFLESESFKPDQIANVENIISEFPSDVSVTCRLHVEGEEVDEADKSKGPLITVGAVVMLYVYFTRPSKKFTTQPPKVGEDSSMDEEFNDYRDADKEKEAEKNAIYAHSPFYPMEKKEHWWVILDDGANEVKSIKKILALRDKTFVKVPFMAPAKTGSYNWSVQIVCDSYVGFDKVETIKFKAEKEREVKQVQKVDDDDDLDEFSDEEDEKAPKIEDVPSDDSDSD